MKKKSKKSTAKRLLEFEDRWAPDNVSLASIKTSIPTQTMVTVPKLSKKKRSWTMWGVFHGEHGGLCSTVYRSQESAQGAQDCLKCLDVKVKVKKVKVTEV